MRPKKSIEIGTDTHFPAIYVPYPYAYKVASIIKQIRSVYPQENNLAIIAERWALGQMFQFANWVKWMHHRPFPSKNEPASPKKTHFSVKIHISTDSFNKIKDLETKKYEARFARRGHKWPLWKLVKELIYLVRPSPASVKFGSQTLLDFHC